MTVLSGKQRKMLDRITLDHKKTFTSEPKLGTGIGTKTIESLLDLRLIEVGPNARHYRQIAWRLTDDGWRCMPLKSDYGDWTKEFVREPSKTQKMWNYFMRSA